MTYVTLADSTLSDTRPAGAALHVAADDYTDAWSTPDTVLMLHGIAESGAVWRAWAPHLARVHRVLRVDMRGFGKSSPLPPGAFGLDDWADDIERVVAGFGARRVHIIASKLGALVAFALAGRHPPWLASLTLAGMLASPSGSLGAWVEDWVRLVKTEGVRGWAAATMPGRMGNSLPPAGMAWWTDIMGAESAATTIHCFRLLPGIPGPPTPERIACPTLFILAGGAGAVSGSYDQRPPPEDMLQLQARVPGSRAHQIVADSYHIAATHPDACAQVAADFIAELRE